jgi:hypothetical protein
MQKLLLRVGVPVAGLAAIALAWSRFGWQGVAVVGTALIMWALMHFNRMMQVLKRTADRPVGYVDSAVMLNAKLQPGVALLHVLAMTRSLGLLQTARDQQPEVYRWKDNSDSTVDCTFQDGRLVQWQMVRPEQPPVDTSPGGAQSPPAP